MLPSNHTYCDLLWAFHRQRNQHQTMLAAFYGINPKLLSQVEDYTHHTYTIIFRENPTKLAATIFLNSRHSNVLYRYNAEYVNYIQALADIVNANLTTYFYDQ